MKDFSITIKTWHKNDMGEDDNVSCDLSHKNCTLSHLYELKTSILLHLRTHILHAAGTPSR